MRLRESEAEPAKPGHLLPEVVALSARIFPQRADDGWRHVLVEEGAGGAAQELLVGAEREVHAPPRIAFGRRELPWGARVRARR
jgi:hypothetical protein